MTRQLTILGSGGSMGTPVIGCTCAACRSHDPKDRRGRSAAWLEWDGKSVLIDAGPDLRLQCVEAGIVDVDGLILTHAHFDHTAGMNDLRILKYKRGAPTPCLLSEEAYGEIMRRYDYLSPFFDFSHFSGAVGEMEFMGIPFAYFSYVQGGMDVKGLRFGDFAYVTDIKEYDAGHVAQLEGVERLVVSGLRETPSPVHLSLGEAVEFAQKVGVKKAWFTHVAHELTIERGNSVTPDSMELAYDGLVIPI